MNNPDHRLLALSITDGKLDEFKAVFTDMIASSEPKPARLFMSTVARFAANDHEDCLRTDLNQKT